jgi:hypothetical protein
MITEIANVILAVSKVYPYHHNCRWGDWAVKVVVEGLSKGSFSSDSISEAIALCVLLGPVPQTDAEEAARQICNAVAVFDDRPEEARKAMEGAILALDRKSRI